MFLSGNTTSLSSRSRVGGMGVQKGMPRRGEKQDESGEDGG